MNLKEKKGAAISYSFNKPVPEILAVARGHLVDRLLQIAMENNITIYEDADLAEMLSLMKPGDEIPESLFRSVAEVLAYCYNINIKFREKLSRSTI